MITATNKWKAPILTTLVGVGSLRKPNGAKSFGGRIDKLLVEAGYAEYYNPPSPQITADEPVADSKAGNEATPQKVEEAAVDTIAESEELAESQPENQSIKGKRKSKSSGG